MSTWGTVWRRHTGNMSSWEQHGGTLTGNSMEEPWVSAVPRDTMEQPQGEQQELVMVLYVEVLFTGVPEILTAVSVLGLFYPGHVMKGPISRTFPCCLFSTVQGEILTEGSTP